MKPPLKPNQSDDYQTPRHALSPLLPYLKPRWHIWEPACGKGNLSTAFTVMGYNVTASDIAMGCDFLAPADSCGVKTDKIDCIITNPPYKYKTEFLEKCYEYHKPFALLLPLTTLETKRRQNLMGYNGIEIILLPKRINFELPNGKKAKTGSWFGVAWFTSGLHIGRDITFYTED